MAEVEPFIRWPVEPAPSLGAETNIMQKYVLSAAFAALLAAMPALAQQSGQTGQSGSAGMQQQMAQTGQSGQQGLVANIAQEGIAEVLVSNLALAKTRDPAVESFAAAMINHHTHANMELAKLVQGDNVMLPAMPGQEHMQTLQRLQSLSANEFDRAYIQHQVQAHERTVNLLQQAARAQDQEIQRFARMNLPLIQAHQQIAQQLSQGSPAMTGSTGQTGSGQTGAGQPGGASQTNR